MTWGKWSHQITRHRNLAGGYSSYPVTKEKEQRKKRKKRNIFSSGHRHRDRITENMPSRNNPNLPSSLNRRVLSHRRTKSRARSTTSGGSSRQEPTAPIRKSLSGVVRGRTVAPKKLQKMARNQNYALQRRNKLMAELPKARGEIEMTGMLKEGGH